MAHVIDAKDRILDAAVAIILAKGYEAMRIDELCQRTGLTKGAVFHYFRNKEEIGVAAAGHFAAKAEAMFERAAYHDAGEARERLLGYIEHRKAMMRGDLQDFTCLFGMMAQETYVTHPQVSEACGAHIRNHARTLTPDIAAAQTKSSGTMPGDAEGLALFMQAVVQGAFVLSKATGDPAVAVQCLDHLKRYVTLLFQSDAPAE